jgi:hypothetical protein
VKGTHFSPFIKAAILLLVVCAASTTIVFAAPQPTSGYVQYTVSVSGQDGSILQLRTFTVNESAKPTTQNGFVAITLTVASSAMNFSYSRDINASSLPEIFPYLPGIANQSFSYQMQGISISAEIANTGNVQAIYNGTSYQATNYHISLSATNSTNGKPISASGNIVTLPSSLIYSTQLSINGVNGTIQVNAQLLSTNLQLTSPAAGINPLGATVIGAGVIAAIAIAIPTISRVKHKSHSDTSTPTEKHETRQDSGNPQNGSEEKPSYWVD